MAEWYKIMMKLTKQGLSFNTVAGKNIFKGVFMLVIFLTVFCLGSAILNRNWTSNKYDTHTPEQFTVSNFDEFEE